MSMAKAGMTSSCQYNGDIDFAEYPGSIQVRPGVFHSVRMAICIDVD
jgi:hypothetical protein